MHKFAVLVPTATALALLSACANLPMTTGSPGGGPAPVSSNAPRATQGNDIAGGLRQALEQGASYAVRELGRPGGFLDSDQFRIGLPGSLDKVAQGLRLAGQGHKVDAFVTSMNRAAEAAVPASLEVLKSAVRAMTVQDAQGILQGGDTAATDYLKRVGGADIQTRILPLVTQATQQTEVTRYYKNLMGGSTGALLGGLTGRNALDLDHYITEKTTTGLFTMIAEEEKKIRRDPIARTTDLLRQVFGR
ncbi:MAG: DUF4197 domain-containing protein [Thiotrichales bacterium]